MMTSEPLTPADVRRAHEAFLRLASLVAESQGAQWEAPPRTGPIDDGPRGKGTHSDPTSAIVLDDRRLALRATWSESRLRLKALTLAAETLTEELADRIDAWNGTHLPD